MQQHHQNHDVGVVVFSAGSVCCAVCAPSGLRSDLVENEVSLREPRGSVLRWRAFQGTVHGVANPRTCPHHPGRQHWLMVRDVRR